LHNVITSPYVHPAPFPFVFPVFWGHYGDITYCSRCGRIRSRPMAGI
jgi:hypothetical protein